MRTALFVLAAGGIATAALAQSTPEPSLAVHALPGYLGGAATTLTADTPTTALPARSLRVVGSWQVCTAVNYGGTCQTVTADQPLFRGGTIRSARPTPGGTTTIGTTAAAAGTSARLDLDSLDPAGGTNGQDVEFYATPAFGSDQVSAGTNDRAAADAFCKRAGATSSVFAGRGRVQQSNLIDLTTATRVRAFPLRDVLCRR